MSYERSRVLLAYGIASWDTALAHLYALRQVGERVPWGAIGQMELELHELIGRWEGEGLVEFPSPQRERIVREARAYLAKHGDDLERYRE